MLTLEHNQGCRDRAVMRGLDAFLANWQVDVENQTPDSLNAGREIMALLSNYTEKDRPQREQAVRAALAKLERMRSLRPAEPRPKPDRPSREPKPRQRPDDDLKAPRGSAERDVPPEKISPPQPSERIPETTTHVAEPPAPPPEPPQPERTAPQSEKAVSEPLQPQMAQGEEDSTSFFAVYEAAPPDFETGKGARARAKRTRPPQDPPKGVGLDSPVIRMPGIKGAYAQKLARLGIRTIRNMLYLFPRRYDDYSALKTIHELVYGEEITLVGTVWQVKNRPTQRGITLTEAILSDATGTIQVTWFNQPYLARQLKPGNQIVVSGKVDAYLGRLVFQSPQWELLDRDLIHTARIVPVYPLTEGITANWLRKQMWSVVEMWSRWVPDPLTVVVRERQQLLDLPTALAQMHFPESQASLAQARRRLAFDEFLLIQLGVLRQRQEWDQQPGQPIPIDQALLQQFLNGLPYKLTHAQQRALDEILHDLQQPRPMSRLLQGDVGSGKTVVAAAALLVAVANGRQAVFMAPTEILAEQHYKTLTRLITPPIPPQAGGVEGGPRVGEQGSGGAGEIVSPPLEHTPSPLSPHAPRIGLLVGKLKGTEKAAMQEAIAAGQIDIVVGTHAVIQEGVSFPNLGLAIVDEQHRFGVAQRAAIRQKGFAPHVLVMTATPIPRTLALTVYGDLDLSIIDEMPPGRQEIKTRWLMPRERERAYQFVKGQVEQGRQAFIICPLIEESDKIEAKAATVEYERLQKEVFPQLKLGLLHGKLPADEKEAVMNAFYQGELHILVSTSVVEVGIDVPNATVMLVEGANRFGLAQLHQFRGRVGRGEHQSYCLLLADSTSAEAEARLQALERTQDGFALAEEDLKLRGPGEFFGTRQSGLPDLKVARLSDVHVLEQARAEAAELFRQDPDLIRPEHAALAAQIRAFWRGEGDLS
ncbi:MAG: ATP-dependent DNA helicase RecG [Chloroflexi bacterium RBG_16_57_9]|nr:MAG: ATP-dependent DNA helicase RecG [Chloroflexi bacterium RBG_16_57_9]